MKKIIFAAMCMLVAISAMAQRGTTCGNPLPLTEDAIVDVQQRDGGYYYKVSTYLLPIKLYFIPEDESKLPAGMYATVDFKCPDDPIYPSEKIKDAVDYAISMGKEVPYRLNFSAVNNEKTGGKNGFYIEINETYRNAMFEFGLTEEMYAFVHINFPCDGKVDVNPDVESRTCRINGSDPKYYLAVDKSYNIVADDKESVYMLSLPDWKEDSVQIEWNGTHDPLYIYLSGETCNFEPTTTDPWVLKDTVFTIEPSSKLKISAELNESLTKIGYGGVYYAKFVSKESAQIQVKKVPLSDPLGGAEALVYDRETKLNNGESGLYYILHKSWSKNATKFIVKGSKKVKMYFGKDNTLDPADSKTYIAEYVLSETADGCILELSSAELTWLSEYVGTKENYMYIKFVSEDAATVTPVLWSDVKENVNNTLLLRAGVEIPVPNKGNKTSKVYRMNFADWADGQIKIGNTGDASLKMYFISDYAKTQTTLKDNSSFITPPTIGYGLEKIYAHVASIQSVSKTWAANVDADGYIYIMAVNQTKTDEEGAFVMTSTKVPQKVVIEPDTVKFTEEVGTATIKVNVYPDDLTDKSVDWTVLTEGYESLIDWNPETGVITRKEKAYSETPIQMVATAKLYDRELDDPDLNPRKADTLTVILPQFVALENISLDLSEVPGIEVIEGQNVGKLDSTITSITLVPVLTPSYTTEKNIEWELSGNEKNIVKWDEESYTLSIQKNRHGGEVTLTAKVEVMGAPAGVQGTKPQRAIADEPQYKQVSLVIKVSPYGEYPYSICYEYNTLKVTNQDLSKPIKIANRKGEAVESGVVANEDYYEIDLNAQPAGQYVVTHLDDETFVISVIK